MMNIQKDNNAFSGIEAAIVLIAFIAVAVIFGYVLMGLGQNASQEAKNQTLTGIDTIAFAPDGVKGLSGNGKSIDHIQFWMYGGNSKVDMTKVTMDFITADETYPINGKSWTYTYAVGDGDPLLERGERMLIDVTLDGKNKGVLPDQEFTLKVMTSEGITHTISGRAPRYIDPVNKISIL